MHNDKKCKTEAIFRDYFSEHLQCMQNCRKAAIDNRLIILWIPLAPKLKKKKLEWSEAVQNSNFNVSYCKDYAKYMPET